MRIYEGSPRQDFEEVFRSIGAFLDQRGMKDVLLLEAPDGYIVQGLVVAGGNTGTWSESVGSQTKETLTFLDDYIARFMEEAGSRRGTPAGYVSGHYETAFRVIGFPSYFLIDRNGKIAAVGPNGDKIDLPGELEKLFAEKR